MEKKEMAKLRHLFLRIIFSVFLALLLAALLYVAYVFIDYYRVDDNIELEVLNPVEGSVSAGDRYRIVSWNIGFGAYVRDFGFFMDGGDESWARSKGILLDTMDSINAKLSELDGDFYLVQEVDKKATRTYHVDETALVAGNLPTFSYVFAQNWDSPFLFYPFTEPHGASLAGIMTFSSKGISGAVRRSVPVEEGIMKIIDMDRCYSTTRVPGPDGHELVLINFHLSAYTSDGKIAFDQLKLVLNDMQTEYLNGNWVIAGGDFNKDLIGTGSKAFGIEGAEYNWAQPIPAEVFQGYDVTLVAPYDPENPVASCRNADSAYWEGQYQVTVDGFMVTSNVEVCGAEVADTGFAWSDHNPVFMEFILR
ncbi:MAG: hypothetical protein IJ863_00795 [Spirochaetales bacterium]|nr:hypothetical protein [Spirochaetales bacterium]